MLDFLKDVAVAIITILVMAFGFILMNFCFSVAVHSAEPITELDCPADIAKEEL